MSTIKYKIEIFSNWHCSSGLAAGAGADLLVVKDSDGMPFIPGKTIKGLVLEAVEDYLQFTSDTSHNIGDAFGQPSEKEGRDHKTCPMFFTNAELPQHIASKIVTHYAQEYLYEVFSSTQIDDQGRAVDHSLRTTETAIPCTLEGAIYDVPEGWEDIIVCSLGLIKHFGFKRNRGLGRCKITKINTL